MMELTFQCSQGREMINVDSVAVMNQLEKHNLAGSTCNLSMLDKSL